MSSRHSLKQLQKLWNIIDPLCRPHAQQVWSGVARLRENSSVSRSMLDNTSSYFQWHCIPRSHWQNRSNRSDFQLQQDDRRRGFAVVYTCWGLLSVYTAWSNFRTPGAEGCTIVRGCTLKFQHESRRESSKLLELNRKACRSRLAESSHYPYFMVQLEHENVCDAAFKEQPWSYA